MQVSETLIREIVEGREDGIANTSEGGVTFLITDRRAGPTSRVVEPAGDTLL
jgi:hypothetical protein